MTSLSLHSALGALLVPSAFFASFATFTGLRHEPPVEPQAAQSLPAPRPHQAPLPAARPAGGPALPGFLTGGRPESAPAATSRPSDLRAKGEEKHFASLVQLTFGGQNAEGYFSSDDQRIIFQSTRPPYECDQIFSMNLEGSEVSLLSTGTGKTTCAYFFPDGQRVLFASTHAAGPECPPRPDYSKGYVWRVEPTFDIYTANADGTGLKPLVQQPGYDAEATISRDGKKIVFTSDRDGDLELYSMNADGTGVTRLTFTPGYDGGAFFSFDGSKIIYRAFHTSDEKALAENRELLKQGLVKPTTMDLYVMDADGKNVRQVTKVGGASFAPFLHPDGKRVIFSTNHHDKDPKGREFDLFLVNLDGSGLEQVTFSAQFDGFPMWTSDGKRLVFASNRHGAAPRDTNLFLAEWKD